MKIRPTARSKLQLGGTSADQSRVLAASISLETLVERGGDGLARHASSLRRPSTTLGWLATAVAALPELEARARTVDQLSWGSRLGSAAGLYAPLLDGLVAAIADAALTLREAIASHLGRDPLRGDDAALIEEVESYASLLAAAHRSASRRSEFLIGGYVSFLGGAIEAAGAFADARAVSPTSAEPIEVAASMRSRQQALHSDALCSALANAIGGLLAYVRLVEEDRQRLHAA